MQIFSGISDKRTMKRKLKVTKDGKWYRVSLRLMGDRLPIEDLDIRLGLASSSFGIKGEQLSDNPRSETYRTNVWVSEYLTESDVPFEEQITTLLDALQPKATALKEILSLPNVQGELFLGFSSANGQGGAEFSPELLGRIAECGLTLSLDLYPHSQSSEN